MLYPRFIFQTDRDSGFKFEIDGIQDSDLGLQGPNIVHLLINYSACVKLRASFKAGCMHVFYYSFFLGGVWIHRFDVHITQCPNVRDQ